MSGKVDIKQVWHHLEDNLSPSETQKIRQVMDISTTRSFIELDFKKYDTLIDRTSLINKLVENLQEDSDPAATYDDFKGDPEQIFGLKIRGRNQNQELAFIHDEEKLHINIDGYNWPREIKDNVTGTKKHVKLEIEYFESFPQFDKSWRGYKAHFYIWWPIRPEFTITLPLGMYMSEKSKLKLFCFRISKSKISTNYSVWENIKFKGPNVTKKENHNVYSYVIEDEDYKNIYPDGEEIPFIVFRGSYETKHNATYWALFLFSPVLVVLSIAEIISTLFQPKITLPDLPFLVILASFSFSCFELVRLNYIIPLRKLIWGSIAFSVVTTLLILIVYITNFLNNGLSHHIISVVVKSYFIIFAVFVVVYTLIYTLKLKSKLEKLKNKMIELFKRL